MKELESHMRDKVIITDQRMIKKNKELIATLKPKPGQKTWRLDLHTGFVEEAVITGTRAEIVEVKDLYFPKTPTGKFTTKTVSIIEYNPKRYLYCCAINQDTAEKKLANLLLKFQLNHIKINGRKETKADQEPVNV